jgi:hypothetical protein
MHRRTALGNRLGLAVVGSVLLLAGAALLLAACGVYGNAPSLDRLYPAAARDWVHDNHDWLWPVTAAAAILVGLVFLRWLLVQLRVDRLRHLRIDTDHSPEVRSLADLARSAGANARSDNVGEVESHPAEPAHPGRTSMPAAALADSIERELADLDMVRRATAAFSGSPDRPELWLDVTTDVNADFSRIRHHIVTTLDEARRALDFAELPTHIRLTVSRRAGARVERPLGGRTAR